MKKLFLVRIFLFFVFTIKKAFFGPDFFRGWLPEKQQNYVFGHTNDNCLSNILQCTDQLLNLYDVVKAEYYKPLI